MSDSVMSDFVLPDPSLPASCIDILTANLDEPPLTPHQIATALSTEDREALDAIADPLARRRRAAGRALMRLALAERYGCAAAQLPLSRTAQGKPYILGIPLAFSFTAAGRYAALAMASEGPLGIDAVLAGPRRIDAIRRLLGDQAGAEGDRLAPARAWAGLEAYGKALGTVTRERPAHLARLAAQAREGQDPDLALHALPGPPGGAMALVAPRSLPVWRLLAWRDGLPVVLAA